MEEKFMRRRSDDLILVAAFAAFPWCLALCALLSAHRQAARLLSALMGPPPPKKPAQRLVVLIPAFNVASTIGRALQGVLADSCTSLVVVVDGGSTDGTAAAARAAAGCDGIGTHGTTRADGQAKPVPVVVVEAAAGVGGRANCLNLAVCVANEHLHQHMDPGGADDVMYLFLHADTVLPEGFGTRVAEALKDGATAFGAFPIFTCGVRDNPSMFVRTFGRFANTLNNLRSSWMEAPYGDQGLFCRRSTFETVGGFPTVPLMEDSAFCWEARRHGAVRILDRCVNSFASPQWGALGALYVMRNYLFLTLWVVGAASPAWIHRIYYAGRPLPTRWPYADMVRDYERAPQTLLVRPK